MMGSATASRTVGVNRMISRSERDLTSAPGLVVARTRQISFTIVRKSRPTPEVVERKPIGWRALEWRRMLEAGVYANQSDLARGEGVSTAAVSIAFRKLRDRG